MNTALLEQVRDVFDHFLVEAAGETSRLYPTGKPWVKAAQVITGAFTAELMKLFAKQAAAYASRIPESAGKVKEAAGEAASWIETEIFSDDLAWQKQLSQLVLPFTAKSVQTGAEKTLADFQFDIGFDLGDPRAAEIIKQRSIEFAGDVQKATHDKIVKVLSDGVEKGDSVFQMREKIKGLPDFDEYRAERAARTEVLGAMNEGEFQAYADMGAAGKQWKAAHDSRTRDSHRRADGQVQPLDKPFRVGGEDLQHPGTGSAKNRINCRCSISPIFDQETVDRLGSEWTPEKAQVNWEKTKAEKDALKKARLESQRAKQKKYLKKHEGKHATSGKKPGEAA